MNFGSANLFKKKKGSAGIFSPFNTQCWDGVKIVTHGSVLWDTDCWVGLIPK